MTPRAIRQFIAIFGGDAIAKGTVVPDILTRPRSDAYMMGQSDYIVMSLHYGTSVAGWEIPCPFPQGTRDLAQWAAGKFSERQAERAVVEAYAIAARRTA